MTSAVSLNFKSWNDLPNIFAPFVAKLLSIFFEVGASGHVFDVHTSHLGTELQKESTERSKELLLGLTAPSLGPRTGTT